MIDVVVLFFLLGLFAGLARSELKLPPQLYDSLSLVLLLAIGLKGGEGLAKQPLLPLLPQFGAVILLGILQTLLAFAILRRRFATADAASTAAHYGSVSVATFAVGVNWLNARAIEFEPQLPTFLAVMEVPAIMVGIVLARGIGKQTDWRTLAHETFLGKGVTLLLGAMAVALEQEMRARVVESEAEVPRAMAEAFRQGNLGVMDYYRMKNLQADTSMREEIAGADNAPPATRRN